MKPQPLQSLSRADTDILRHGVCPACNKTRFLIGGLLHHERGSYRRILCIHCFREFGVAPMTFNPVTRQYEDQPHAVIIYFILPDRRIASDYHIHTGALGCSHRREEVESLNSQTPKLSNSQTLKLSSPS